MRFIKGTVRSLEAGFLSHPLLNFVNDVPALPHCLVRIVGPGASPLNPSTPGEGDLITGVAAVDEELGSDELACLQESGELAACVG